MKRQKMMYPILSELEEITPIVNSKQKIIKAFKFNLNDVLQTGEYSTIYSGWNIKHRIRVAIKVVLKSGDIIEKGALEQEIVSLRLFTHHPNIVDFYGAYQDFECYYLIFGLMKSDLHSYINKHGAMTEAIAKKVITQVGRAVRILHFGGVSHRDIKLENILIDGTSIQLCDLGFSKKISEEPFNDPCGSPYTVAPEILNRKGFGSKVDMWAIGCILFVMLTGGYPCSDGSESDFQIKIKIMTGRREKYPDWFSNSLKNLLEGLLAFKPSNRITIDQMMNHPWIQ